MSSNQIPKRSLGNERLKVSAIGLGTMTMPDNKASINTIRGDLDYGVTLFDTADLYGIGTTQDAYFLQKKFGDNEKPLGKALKGQREEEFLAVHPHI